MRYFPEERGNDNLILTGEQKENFLEDKIS